MKAVIFNSGLGKRMGELTAHGHKSMVPLINGETIFTRQLRLLKECGVRDFVVTVGPFKEQLKEAASAPRFKDCRFTFVENPVYDSTNYIYSMYLAREAIAGDDVLMLHGDLVFNRAVLERMLADERGCLATCNTVLPLPEKDFKARIQNGVVSEVSVKIFDKDCCTFQPMYKLTAAAMEQWLQAVAAFIADGNDQVYAENAINPTMSSLGIAPFGYENDYVEEIDNPDDYARVTAGIRPFDYAEQRVLMPTESVVCLKEQLHHFGAKNPLFVVDSAWNYLFWSKESWNGVFFTDFSPNPQYTDVLKGLQVLRENACDAIVSVGGGSAIDTAKAIRAFSAMPAPQEGQSYLDMPQMYPDIPHIAIPTTAGTGSESTRFSVIYYEGAKQSLTGDALLPDVALLAPQALVTLPLTQKKATVLDALCQCIESLWSVNANDRSRRVAEEGLTTLLANVRAYLAGDVTAAQAIMRGANLSGQAINISQTTAAHAMSYKITSLCGTPHGHAVALCLPSCWERLWARRADTTLPGGETALNAVFDTLARAFDVSDGKAALDAFCALYADMALDTPCLADATQIAQLVASVNPVRLKNFPLMLDTHDFEEMYTSIFA